jgi:hypothetical protein
MNLSVSAGPRTLLGMEHTSHDRRRRGNGRHEVDDLLA